MIKINNKMMN